MSLTFNKLRKANVIRCRESFHANGVMEWSPTDWATAMAGECGEACNFIKKMRRGDKVKTRDVAKELADLVIYVDLLAARLNISLGDIVKSKFNEVSRKKNSKVFLK